jgi:hypothetical protein
MITSNLILITLTIPMVFIIVVLSMVNHEYKKSLRGTSQNPTNLEDE